MQLRPNVKFHLAGDGPLLSEVEQLVTRYQMAEKFNVHGAITDVPAFLSSIHIAVLCSQSEGLSHAILEYMAAGRATIATNVGGNSELIEHGSNGLLIPVNDCDALVTAIQTLIDDQELALQLGSRARTLVSEKYSCESMARRFERLYVRLAKGSKEFALMESTAP